MGDEERQLNYQYNAFVQPQNKIKWSRDYVLTCIHMKDLNCSS
jgi:hypothetical protein